MFQCRVGHIARRLIYELVRKLGPPFDLYVRIVILSLSRPLSSSRYNIYFAVRSTPLNTFG